MPLYSDTVQDDYKRPIPGVAVTVTTATGALAALTNNAGAALANPVTTDRYGRFSFNAANAGYTLEYRYGGELIRVDTIVVGPIGVGPTGPPGINGGVGTGDGSAALFAAANGMAIDAGVSAFDTAGYSVPGRGAGRYVYDPVINAAFVAAHPGWSFLAADGAGFKLSSEQPLKAEMFGFIADYVSKTNRGTNNYASVLVMLDFLHSHNKVPSGNSYYKTSPEVTFRPEAYYVDPGTNPIAIDLTNSAYRLKGGGGYEAGATSFMIAEGKSGMILQSWDTSGVNGTKPNNGVLTGASYSIIRNINVVSLGGTVGDVNQIGIGVRCHAELNRCSAYEFGCDGIQVYGNTFQPDSRGNANQAKLIHCSASGNGRDGMRLQGSDGNAIHVESPNATGNRGFGINDLSFLGITLDGVGHTDFNGVVGSGPSWAPASERIGTWTHFGGRLYRVVPGMEILASTTQPGTNPLVYRDMGAGSPNTVFPTWVSGMRFVSGGPLYSYNPNARSDFKIYIETNQPAAWLDAGHSYVMGGFSNVENGAHVYADGSMRSRTGWGTPNGNLLDDGGLHMAGDAVGRQLDMMPKDLNIEVAFGGLDGSTQFVLTGNDQTKYKMGRLANAQLVPQFPRGFGLGDCFIGVDDNVPAGTDYGPGEYRFRRSLDVGGVAARAWAGAALGWQPVGIVGAVQAASVPLAAGATPTKAEFDALVTALKNAKAMA